MFVALQSGKPPQPSVQHQVKEAFNNSDLPYSYITTLAFCSLFESFCDTESCLSDKDYLRPIGHVHEFTSSDDIDHAIYKVILLQAKHIYRHLAGV